MNEVLTNGSRPSPTPSNPPSTVRNSVSVSDLPNVNTASEIRCFCGYDSDDGFTIQCERCLHWQHARCVNINQNSVPETFICYYCEVRDLTQADITRAREYQLKEIGGGPKKTQAQAKRGTGASHRRRDTNGAGHSRSYSESTSHKLQAPKDHPAGKSRGRQRPISTQAHTNLPDTSASPDEHSPTGKSPSMERELGSDSEVPPSVYTKEYSPITCNTIVSPEVDHKIKTWTHDAVNNRTKTTDASLPCIPRRYSSSEFHELIPSGHTVRYVSSPEELSSIGLPLIRLVADTPSKADQFVIEYVGEIGSKTSYIQDTLNQYGRIRHPKAFVLFHPQLPIYIDARRCGSEARFVRRSCRPNLKFETMVIDGTDLKFALYTSQPIERGAELTIGWEWDNTLPFARLLDDATTVEELEPELVQRMKTWADTVTATVGECACPDSDVCLMARLKGDAPVGKSKKVSKSGTKRRWREMHESNSTGREMSPEKQDPEAKYKRRSSSTSSHRKSESRDRTPTYITADITQSSVITDQNSSAREARKMKDTINLIEKLTNPESSHNRGKRVKRSGLPPSAQSAFTLDLPEKLPKLVAEPGPIAAPSAVGQAMGPNKALNSNQSSPGKQVNGTSPPRLGPKVSYVDDGVQTDADITTRAPIHSLPTSRKMRILAQFRAQSAQRENALKSQLSIVKEEEFSPKEATTVSDGDVVMADDEASAQQNTSPLTPLLEIKSEQSEQINMAEMDVDIATKPLADSDASGDNITPAVVSAPKTPLSVQLPPTPPLPSVNIPPQNTTKQVLSTPSASSTSPISPFQPQTPSLPAPANTTQSTLPTPPAPSTGRKKMSLSDYTRKKAESLEKDKVGPTANHLPTVVDSELEVNGARSSTPAESTAVMDLDPPTTNILANGA
ncbi:hypothetical protein TWF225_000712 [Orbilia oligospora]|nr:hypothetical protein TWF225_000712 [Orbilia oligospora]KAF3244832.1 hypothetical protein TWF217_010663 [Orbilia oligospora]KAF3246966.1 hypothetical protein TWF128_008740 [Orbilia oligospora]KAF3246967.1 hypothetical protein TWF128_008740 [Orbilia oligospora]KAF3281390.1 hypothetical protein TWF132_011269 [Orbilia oligospora]